MTPKTIGIIGIEGGTREALLKKFRENSEHFGENNLDPGNQLFDRLIGVMVDLSSGNLIAFQANEDRPGLLHEIIGFLAKHKINMTSLHSFKADCGHRFMIGIEDPPTSEKVRHAIDEIEGKIGGVTFRDSLKL